MLNKIISITALAFIVMVSQMTTDGLAADDNTPKMTIQTLDNPPVTLSLGDIDAMEQVEFTTSTIWTDEKVTFTGVSLTALLDKIAAKGSTLELVALNDYSISMPISEIDKTMPIVATRMNGELMSVRDKGPFWLVYNYDSDKKLQTEVIYSRSIWQLAKMNIAE